MRHDFACGCDFSDFFDVARIQQERDLRFAGIDSGECVGGFAFVGQIGFLGDGLRRDAERGFEDSFVQKDNVELALERRDVWKKLSEVGARAKNEQEECALVIGGGGIGADGTLRHCRFKAREKVFTCRFFFGVVGESKHFSGEPRFEMAANGRPGKIVNVGGDAVRRKNDETFAAGVDESHHGRFVGRVRIGRACLRAALIAIIECGFVAMVAVGDDEFLISHCGLDYGNFLRIGDDPETMRDAVFVVDFGGRRRGFFGFLQNGINVSL